MDTVPDITALDFLVYNPRFISNRQISEIIQNTTARPINLDVYCGDEIVLSRRHPNAIWTGTGNAEIFRPVDRDCLVAKYRKVRSRKKNEVTLAGNYVVKKSKDITKLRREFNFIKAQIGEGTHVFPEVRDFKVVEDNASYEIEYIEPGDISSFFIDGDADFLKKRTFSILSNYFEI